MNQPSYPHLGIHGSHTRADRELVAKHMLRIGDQFTQGKLGQWVIGHSFGIADADEILAAAADAVAEARRGGK